MSHESLSPAEAERLHMLIEEAGEVIQASTKILRHGYQSHNPDVSPPVVPNRLDLERELADLIAVVSSMGVAGDILLPDEAGLYSTTAARTWERKLRYTHHQGARK